MWIIDDEFDASLPLPRGDRDIPLMIVDRSFDKRNQLTDPFSELRPRAQRRGHRPLALVNGVHLPHHRVSAARHRVRVLNASNFSLYNLELSNGDPMIQIATESGLMPAPVRRKQVLIGPGERVELIVDFTGCAGKRVELQSARRKDERRARLEDLRGPADASSGSADRAPTTDQRPGDPAPATRPGSRARQPAARPQVGVHDREGPDPDLAGQRQDLRPGALRRVRRSSARPRPGSSTTAPRSPT